MRLLPVWLFGARAQEEKNLMASEPIVIDATGDVLFTLTNPWAKFAVWDHHFHDAGSSGDETVVAEETDVSSQKLGDEREEDAAPVPVSDLGPPTRKRKKAQDSPEQPRTKRRHRRSSNWWDNAPPEIAKSLIFRVSSKLLMNASPRFRKELTSWGESSKAEDELYRLETFDWDPEALGILLNTLHLRHRKVPKELTLEMLAKVAVLVDYYKCWEAFDFIAPIWIVHARKHWPVDTTITRHLMLWMMVSWVFKLPQEFTYTTERVIRLGREEHVRDLGLGIPKSILVAMESRRIQTIAKALEVCRYWMDKFETDWRCEVPRDSHQCGSMLLGALSREMRRLGLRSPELHAPYDGLSVESVCRDILDMQSPSWTGDDGKAHPCSFCDEIDPEIERILEETGGLELDNFSDRNEGTDSARRSPGVVASL